MLNSAPLVAFAAITDPERAKTFYGQTLGLRLVGDEPFALVFDANGTTLRLSKVEAFSPQPFTVLGWIVTDIGAVLDEFTARGVVFERYGGMPQDDQGVCTFPGGTRVAWFKDPDGNVLSLTQVAP